MSIIESSVGFKDVITEGKILRTFFNFPESRQCMTLLFPQVFSEPHFGVLFKMLKEMHLHQEPVGDQLYVYTRLKGILEFFQFVDILEYEKKNPDKIITDPNAFVFAINHLKKLYFIRLSNNLLSKMTEAAYEGETDKMVKIASTFGRIRTAIFHSGEERSNAFEEAAAVVNSPEEYIPTAFSKLNEMIGGWTKSDISSVGGKSGHNKTTFVLYDALQSIKQGRCKKLLYVSVDEPAEKIARRIIASQMNISLSAMRNKTVRLDAREVSDAINTVFKDKIIIIDNIFSGELIQQAILDSGADRTIIDHIQELDFGSEGISDQKVMINTKLFKEAARITKSNVTIVSQVRDKLIDERFEDKIPRSHDFLYASDLRRKSREQCVVYWEFKDTQRDVDFSFFDFIVWKSTYSGTGRIKFLIDPDYARFAEKSASRSQLEQPQTPEDVWRNIDRI